MRVMIVGNGGREHALAHKAKQSPLVSQIIIAPGNPGTAQIGHNVAVDSNNPRDLLDVAKSYQADLTIIGPENPLAMGVADLFKQHGLRCFGPGEAAARIESSKSWSKGLMAGLGVPTAEYRKFSDSADALSYLKTADYPQVIKADGLAAGKGVSIVHDFSEASREIELMMVSRVFGRAGESVIIEEFLLGDELTVLAMCNGRSYCLLPSSRDHKSVFDGGKGPNTGGMGAYCPVDAFDSKIEGEVRDRILEPVLWAMQKEGAPYTGVLYCGLMLTEDGPKVIEFNSRFGDPETQPTMCALDYDIVELALACTDGDPSQHTPEASSYAACVVMASEGYPASYKTGVPISGIEHAQQDEAVTVFQAGTRLKDGRLVTSGGRVLGITATGASLDKAIEHAYNAVSKIDFEGAHYRKDIGRRTQ